MKSAKRNFAKDQQSLQISYFDEHFAEIEKHKGRPFQLNYKQRLHGLLPAVRDVTERLFDKKSLGIQFHSYVGHGRSSQACCINFLMPFADKPDLLSRWVSGLLEIEPPVILPVEKELAGPHRFVAFEYTGPDDGDFLGEAEGGVPGRGAHATASDAAVAFQDAKGVRHLLLIEWKYTEEYGSHRLSEDVKGKRKKRYGDKLLAPAGPIRNDLNLGLSDFLFEPFYQLARQQMLAWQIEEKSAAFDKVRVLHLSPSGNRALHKVTSPKFLNLDGTAYDDAFVAFHACLVDPAAFIDLSIENAFAPLAIWPEAGWWGELARRYETLCLPPVQEAKVPT